jgi:hypothetical protein
VQAEVIPAGTAVPTATKLIDGTKPKGRSTGIQTRLTPGASKALSIGENGAGIGKLILLLETHSLRTATKIYYAKDFVYKKYHKLGKNI